MGKSRRKKANRVGDYAKETTKSKKKLGKNENCGGAKESLKPNIV